MDADVEKLVREERLVQAAELAASRGDSRTASSLFERACDFRRAAEHALKSNDWPRALPEFRVWRERQLELSESIDGVPKTTAPGLELAPAAICQRVPLD